MSQDSFAEVAAQLRYDDVAALYAAVGEGHVSTQSVHREGRSRSLQTRGRGRRDRAFAVPKGRARPLRDSDSGVLVRGAPDILVKLAKCCTPVPGDEIVGFVTRGSGVSVHQADCHNVQALLQRARADDRRRVGADLEERLPRADPDRGARPRRAALRRHAGALASTTSTSSRRPSRPRATGWRSAGSSSRWATPPTSTACSTPCGASTPSTTSTASAPADPALAESRRSSAASARALVRQARGRVDPRRAVVDGERRALADQRRDDVDGLVVVERRRRGARSNAVRSGDRDSGRRRARRRRRRRSRPRAPRATASRDRGDARVDARRRTATARRSVAARPRPTPPTAARR